MPCLWRLRKHMPQKDGFKGQNLHIYIYKMLKLDNSWKPTPLINLTLESCNQASLVCIWFSFSVTFHFIPFNLSYRLYSYILDIIGILVTRANKAFFFFRFTVKILYFKTFNYRSTTNESLFSDCNYTVA